MRRRSVDKNKRPSSFHFDTVKIRLRLNENLAANIRDWSDQVTGGHIAISVSALCPSHKWWSIIAAAGSLPPMARIIRVLASAQSWGLAILCFLTVCCHCIQVWKWYIWWCFWSVSLHGDDDMSSKTVTNASLSLSANIPNSHSHVFKNKSNLSKEDFFWSFNCRAVIFRSQ